MRHRIYVEAIAPTVTVAGDEFHHSIRVVRVHAGEEVELFDGAGHAARGTVESIERDQAVIRIDANIDSRESSAAIHLAMAIIQLDKFELVLQKATELGVRSIIPMVTERVEVNPQRYAGKEERWERIVFEAVKQSGRAAVPRIEAAAPFEDIIARNGAKILFDADAEPTSGQSHDSVTILIGPEGGWSEDELRIAREQGCAFQRLGPRRLRAETAAIVAVAVTASRFGDL